MDVNLDNDRAKLKNFIWLSMMIKNIRLLLCFWLPVSQKGSSKKKPKKMPSPNVASF